MNRLDIITNEGSLEELIFQCRYNNLSDKETALKVKEVIDDVVRLVIEGVSSNNGMHKSDIELQRLFDWLQEPNREPAKTKFTAGMTRNVAREIDFLLKR